jgi:hypothetical protein
MSIVILLWHVFLGLGGLLGFVSTGFLVYDRLLPYRPIASLNAVLGFGHTSQSHASPTLHVKNAAPFHILIERFTVSPPYCTVAPSVEFDGTVDVMSGTDTRPRCTQAMCDRDDRYPRKSLRCCTKHVDGHKEEPRAVQAPGVS